MSCDSQFSLPEFVELSELDTIEIMNGDNALFDIPSPQLDDDTTLDSPMQFSTSCPSPLGPPDRTHIQNNYNFGVDISSADTNKKKYLYSCQLNRVYVDMNCDFAVQFSWQEVACERVYVRATVVFSDKEQAEKRVERCMQHRHENTANVPEAIRMNVLRSSREIGTHGVYYHGDPQRPDSWYSVLVEFANSGQPCQHAFKFVCKNSCSSGINRRAIAIIFSLEDALGNVYGRHLVGVRVCACPRRDLLKDEEAEGVFKSGKKRVPANKIDPPRTKKIKLEVVPNTLDDTVMNLPQLQVVGVNVMTTGLEMMIRMMEQGARARSDDAQYIANVTACIAGLKAAIDQYKSH